MSYIAPDFKPEQRNVHVTRSLIPLDRNFGCIFEHSDVEGWPRFKNDVST